ncbi:MAG TPA: ATP-binding protein [Bradyrhizobium sp.]|nr:ATP-binding protein [Bradyrhizobium sp.]
MLIGQVRGCLKSLAELRHGIGARLLGRMLLFSGVLTVILTALQLHVVYRRDVSDIESRLDEISGSYLDSLAEGLWTLDEKQLQLQLDGILRLPDVRFVEVHETGNTPDPLVVELGERSDSSVIARDYPLHYKVQGQDSVIGTLHVEATLSDMYRRLADTAWIILASQAAEIFLVSLFIFYIFHHLITRHLSAIAAYVGNYRIESSSPELRLRRRPSRHPDELQRVITAFNALSHDLHTAYQSLRDVNDELARDVAARRQAEAILREREARVRYLVDADIIGIFIWNFDGRILEANETFLRLVGYDHEDLAAGRIRWMELTPPDWLERDAEWIQEHQRTGRRRPIEKEYFRKDGSRVPVLLGAATFVEGGDEGVAFVLDLTERRQAEQALQEAQAELARANRVAAIGQLTASIAHEVNQPVGAMVADAQAAIRFLESRPPDLEEVGEALASIVKGGFRAGHVVSRIRALVKKAPPQTESVDMNEAIREVIVFTRGEAAKHGISVETQLADGLPLIQGDRVQLQQVVLNLVLNAIEAMTDDGKGPRELLIKTARPEPDSVSVAVQDSGPGLDAASSSFVFEPFHTTKPEGLGIGLSICRSIVEAHGGKMAVTKNEPRGAIFQFTLPARGYGS